MAPAASLVCRVLNTRWPVSDEVRQLILERADSKAIKEKARSHGMKTLREAGWSKVQKRVTTIPEVLRVTQVEN
jgi:type II secretory ATPase GspE/PulE/Tfp pilus assembly ATPase PilB-like protein